MLLRVRSLGVMAAKALRAGRLGTVRATFARSIYLTVGEHWLCAGPPALGEGPLNLLCEAWPAPPPVGAAVEIGLAGLHVWQPAPPAEWSLDSLRRGLAAFDEALPATLPEEGLALLLRPPPDQVSLPRVARAALAPAAALASLAASPPSSDETTADARILVPLIGLGPGLTPSGDDFLGGAMVALHYLGADALRNALWAAIEPHAERGTSSISFAHLEAAAAGFPGEALHDLLGAVMTGQGAALPSLLARIDAIGHTSGWDAAAGAAVVLRAVGKMG